MNKKRRLIHKINIARHAMMKSMDAECLNTLGVSVVQLTALMVLKQKKQCQMKDLALALQLDKSAVTGLVKRLQSNGLANRVVSHQDARVFLLCLTEKGKEKLTAGLPLLAHVNSKMNDGFTELELDIVSRYLTHVSKTFTKKGD